MINNIIVTGGYEALMKLQLPEKSNLELANRNWMTNCFGVDINCYCHEVLTPEQEGNLFQKYNWVDTGNYWINIYHQYDSAIRKNINTLWTWNQPSLLKNLGLKLNLKDDYNNQTLRRLSYLYASLRCLQYDIARPEEYVYILNSDLYTLKDLPDIQKTSSLMLKDFKSMDRHQHYVPENSRQKVSIPLLNNSAHMWATPDFGIAIAQTMTMHRFLDSRLLMETMLKLKFINSDMIPMPETILAAHAKSNTKEFNLHDLAEWRDNGKLT